MSKPERVSLTNLKQRLPDLGRPPAKGLEKQILQTDVQPSGEKDVEQAVKPAIKQESNAARFAATSLRPKQKEPAELINFRLRTSVATKLRRIAEHNKLSMKDIVEEALERHFPNFPWPSDLEGN